MNIVKMSVATVLALVYLMLAIPLAFSILILFVVFGLPAYYLVNRVNSKSKAYKVYEMDNRFLNCQVEEWENDFNVYINIYLANDPK